MAVPGSGRITIFAWTLAILLLTAFAFVAWLGSFYVFLATGTARTVIGYVENCIESTRRGDLN